MYLNCACLVAVKAAFSFAFGAEFLNVSLKGFDGGFDVGSVVFAVAFAGSDEFLCV